MTLKISKSNKIRKLHSLHYDIRDKRIFRSNFKNHKIDVLVHLAALAGVRPSIERP